MRPRLLPAIILAAVTFASGCRQDAQEADDTSRYLWSFRTGDVEPTCPALAPDGTIYIGSHDFHLYALDANGGEKWRFKTDGFVHGSAVVGADGRVFFGSFDGRAYALDPAGKELWRFQTGDKIESCPALVGRRLYVPRMIVFSTPWTPRPGLSTGSSRPATRWPRRPPSGPMAASTSGPRISISMQSTPMAVSGGDFGPAGISSFDQILNRSSLAREPEGARPAEVALLNTTSCVPTLSG